MPPPPQVGQRVGGKGIIEVLQEVKSKHPAQTDGHVGIAGEVVVQLEDVSHRSQPGKGGGQSVSRHTVGPVGDDGQLIGQQHLLAQAYNKPGAAGGEVLPALLPVVDLVGHRLIFDDGAGNKLGKERDVQSHLQRGTLHLSPVPMDVQHIAEGLEGKEGNADGQFDYRDHKAGTQAI